MISPVQVMKAYPVEYTESMNTVLQQEIIRCGHYHAPAMPLLCPCHAPAIQSIATPGHSSAIPLAVPLVPLCLPPP